MEEYLLRTVICAGVVGMVCRKDYCAANIHDRAYEIHRHVARLSYSIIYDHYSLMWMMVITTYRCVSRNFSVTLFASAAGLMLSGLVA